MLQGFFSSWPIDTANIRSHTWDVVRDELRGVLQEYIVIL